MNCKNCNSSMKKLDESRYICEKCGAKRSLCEVYSRVVGYIRPITQWNDGKQEEFKDRKLFTNESQTKF